ncbi:MAG: helix-turn-helix domain-containing protein, partial [Pseudomonadota bacterium]
MDSALEILEQKGLDKLSLRAVARRAGVSQTAPYSHFENKN